MPDQAHRAMDMYAGLVYVVIPAYQGAAVLATIPLAWVARRIACLIDESGGDPP